MSGICKISGFGILEQTDDLRGEAFMPMQGTLFQMAPEAINTQTKGFNFKVDIWSVGCAVLKMWAGKQPWMGEEMVAVIFKVCSTCCEDIHTTTHSLNGEFQHCTSHQPEFQTLTTNLTLPNLI